MDVLYLDKCLNGNNDFFRDRRVNALKNIFEREGYGFKSTFHLDGISLKDYDLVIAHPVTEDSIKLKEEIDRRKDFRVIFYTVEPSWHSDSFSREDDRDFFNFSNLPHFVKSSNQEVAYFEVCPSRKIIEVVDEWVGEYFQ